MTTWHQRLREPNGIDVLRLVLAVLVVLEHSFFLIDNSPSRDPLYRLTGGQVHFGQFAVWMFFSLSGFLVTDSALRSPSVGSYLLKRVARIVPGFVVACVLACVVLAPLLAPDASAFFAAQRWDLVLANTLALRQPTVTGILPESPVPLIHGTLWSIQYEFDCYLLVALFALAGLMRRPRAAIACFLAFMALLMVLQWTATPLPRVTTGIAAFLISSPDGWPLLFPFFIAGALLRLASDRLRLSGPGLAVAIAVLAVACFAGGLWTALVFFGSYAAVMTGLWMRKGIRFGGRHVDLSYGIYLYGWPVQQVLLHVTGREISPIALFFSAMALTVPVALASWFLVEAPCLRLARRARAAPAKPATLYSTE